VPADTLLEQRIYHLTHLRNLAGVIAQGALIAGVHPVLELSPGDLRDERAEITFPTLNDLALPEFVPFFLSPEASLWQSLRSGRAHPRLSDAAAESDPLDFVFLVSTVRHIVNSDSTFVLADGNVEGAQTRFAFTREEAERMLYRLRAESDETALQGAEFLVAGTLPLESVTLIGVANDKVRQSVRNLLAGTEFTPKISVYPPWFQQSD
jgi:hypothetical protein